jgi:hypothetical protein
VGLLKGMFEGTMISESFYWKLDLLKQAASLRKRSEQRRWPEASVARCEQTIMLGFYSIRKLIESVKLTDVVSNTSVPVRSYTSTGRTVHLLNCHRIDELYDLDKSQKKTFSLPYLCNQVMHSYEFSLLFNEDRSLAGMLLASDRQRSKELLQVSVESIIRIFERVGRDDATVVSLKFDKAKGDYAHTLKK